jgi:hypothetical protein
MVSSMHGPYTGFAPVRIEDLLGGMLGKSVVIIGIYSRSQFWQNSKDRYVADSGLSPLTNAYSRSRPSSRSLDRKFNFRKYPLRRGNGVF